ncbi:MAG: 4Fe-4S dicluster domain-containing protein [Desulfobacteraceae bacterium]|nr:4Fe-4S dicluster domain-containing protein [Desulfobacteraceae bacterium]
MKQSFIRFSRPWMHYDRVRELPKPPETIPMGAEAVFWIPGDLSDLDADWLKVGDKVRTGQKLTLHPDAGGYALSSVTGRVQRIEKRMGDYGRSYVQVTVAVEPVDRWDEAFSAAADTPDLATIAEWLACAPGAPDVSVFMNAEQPIQRLVVNGVDQDLMIRTRNYTLQTEMASITEGIRILKEAAGLEEVVLVVPRDSLQNFGHIGAKPAAVASHYPAGHPHLIMKSVLGRVVPEGTTPEQFGVAFMGVEAVASVGKAFRKRRPPLQKTLTLVRKDEARLLVSTRLGTPIRHVFAAAGITVADRDRIIFGGPLTGSAMYSEDQPVLPDTDAIIVQDSAGVYRPSDNPCINCGECVRICPVNVPVNMLVRFLEAGQYEEAAEQYDLLSCIDCGLCSFVCASRIPIGQFIRLGKHELELIHSAEEEVHD